MITVSCAKLATVRKIRLVQFSLKTNICLLYKSLENIYVTENQLFWY